MKVIHQEQVNQISGGLNLSPLQLMCVMYGGQGLIGGSVLAGYKLLGGPGAEYLPSIKTCLVAPTLANTIGAYIFMEKATASQREA